MVSKEKSIRDYWLSREVKKEYELFDKRQPVSGARSDSGCSASKSEQEREKKRAWEKGEGLRTGGRGMRERVRLSSFPLLLPLSHPLPLLFYFFSALHYLNAWNRAKKNR